MTLKEQVKQSIDNHHKITGGKSGYNIATLRSDLDIQYWILKPVLTELYKDKYFHIRDGISGKLIFKNL